MPVFHAIAAMSENRVIGQEGKIPWHLPEDFRWFKHKTMGGTLVMGRKTFESIGRPLPGRRTIVLSGAPMTGVDTCASLPELDNALESSPGPWWICGGAQIYALLLARCDSLYLTRVKREVDGDTRMPDFESRFHLNQVIHENDQFRLERWLNDRRPLTAEIPLENWSA